MGRSDRDVRAAIDAVWRIEGARIVAALARTVGDVTVAEDLAHDALAAALTQWPDDGVPSNPAAWLTAVAKRRAIDGWRRRDRLDERHRAMAAALAESVDDEWEPIDDDILRLVFVACHPVLGRDAQVAMTLRVVGGLRTEEIARLFLVPVPTVQQRIVRAKRALAAAQVPFEVPEANEWAGRLGGVLSVIYLIFTEGYAATSGERWIRADLAAEALRLGRILAELVPREPEVHAVAALMELQASRFAARIASDGSPVLLADQDRSRWDRTQITRGLAALRRADRLRRGRGAYALQAAIAAQHAVAASLETTDWVEVVALYEALESLTANPVVTVNRAVAVAMVEGPEAGLAIVEEVAASGALASSHLVESVRGELLARLGRTADARGALALAIERCTNDRERSMLVAKLAAL